MPARVSLGWPLELAAPANDARRRGPILYVRAREVTATTVKLLKIGRSQVIRLPREFRFEGDTVRIRRAGRGIVVEQAFTDVTAWFKELDRLAEDPFMPEGRKQPPALRPNAGPVAAAPFDRSLVRGPAAPPRRPS